MSETAIIFDNGSYQTRAGFSNDDKPRTVFPTIVGHKAKGRYDEKSVFVGEDAWEKRESLTVKRTFEAGTVQSWDDLNHIWLHTYNNELRVDSEYYPLLICEATSIPKKDREMNISKAFESFQVPAYYSSFSSELMMYASGKTTGIAVSLGYDGSIICPVYEGKAIRSEMTKTAIGGHLITKSLMEKMNERGYSFSPDQDYDIANKLKETHCYVASDYEAEVVKADQSSSIDRAYQLPDGQIFFASVERFSCPEVLFQPILSGSDDYSIHQAIHRSAMSCDVDIRRSLLDSVILGGGNSLLPQLPERLQLELATLFPPTIKPKLVVPEERKYSVWIGGSILSSLSTFREQWITKGEYDENGAEIVHQRCSGFRSDELKDHTSLIPEIHLAPPALSKDDSTKFPVGTKVTVWSFGVAQSIPGVIKSINGPTSYEILYDDGNIEGNVSESRIRLDLYSFVKQGAITIVENELEEGTFFVDTVDGNGDSFLMLACEAEQREMIDLLLRYEADINFQNPNSGDTALHIAMRKDKTGALGDYLIKRGASSTIQNNIGETAFNLAHQKAKEPQKVDDADYMKEALSQGKKEWGRSKIMIVGEGRAGKTALSNSILGRKYESTSSTVGINEFTCNVGYASVGGGPGAQWSEFTGQKQQREYETAVAKLILDKKAGRVKEITEKQGKGGNRDELEALVRKKTKGGYVEGEKVRLLTQLELEQASTAKKVPRPTSAGAKPPDQHHAHRKEESRDDSQTNKMKAEREGATKHNPIEEKPNKLGKDDRISKVDLKNEVDHSLVMQYLGDQARVDSKFTISVFDFGGQSVFNVIHPFFLTRFGVYILVFNMEWLSSKASKEIVDDCLSYMTFWLNSVIIHTQNEKLEVAPVFFVGTRKDTVSSPAEHLRISTIIYETFSGSLAWPYVVEYAGAVGPNGKADFCFYPINNTQSIEDLTVRELLKRIEETIDGSSYVHVERPLSWFQVLDMLKQRKVPYLAFDDVKKIIIGCDIPEDKVSFLLRFFHEMGILMWHDEDNLRDVVVLDPIDYFVKPATIVICKHVPDQTDGIHHVLDIHRKVRKSHVKEFQEMTKHGIISEDLLEALLESQRENYRPIRALMLKYGLLVPLTLQTSEGWDKNENITTQQLGETLYLSPALLPETKTNYSLTEGSISTQFYFLFTPSNELSQMATISLEDCSHLGFLPNGLFEKLISKAIMWSMKTSDFVSRSTLYGCYKNAAELAFGNQTFRIFADSRHHLISVLVDGKNPVGIHDRLREQLEEIISECLKSLKFITVLRYEGNASTVTTSSNADTTMFVRLNQIRSLVEKKTALSLNLAGGRGLLSVQDAIKLYGPWLVDYTAFEEYDMFISYRWGPRDSDFTLALFDRMTLFSVEDSMRSIRAFLDRKRLEMGENFQSSFVRALSRSLVLVPIVSYDALLRMRKLTGEDEDNVLIEWICGIECMKAGEREKDKVKDGHKSRLMKIIPVFFGSSKPLKASGLEEGDVIGNLFEDKIIEELPDIIPSASLLKAKALLESNGISMTEEMMRKTVRGIVKEVSKFLFLCAWEVQNKKRLIAHAAEKVVPILNDALSMYQRRQSEHGHATGKTTGSDVEENGGAGAALSLNQLKDLVRNELGIASTGVQEVLKEALESLSEEEQAQVSTCKTTKEKALKIAQLLGLV